MDDQTQLDEWISGLHLDFWGTVQHKIGPAEFFQKMQDEGAVLLDLRSAEELRFLTLPFALHIPIAELPSRWQEVPTDRLVGLFCSSGSRAGVAFAYLRSKGLDNVKILEGGYPALVAEMGPPKIMKMLKK